MRVQGAQSDQGLFLLARYDKPCRQWGFSEDVHGVGQFELNLYRPPEIVEYDVDRALFRPFLAHFDAWLRLSFHVDGFELHGLLGRLVGEMPDAVFILVFVYVLGTAIAGSSSEAAVSEVQIRIFILFSIQSH